MQDDVVIGLEIHIQLLTKTKIFCHCSTDYFNQEPNIHTCPVCLGLPGCLPVINREAVNLALKTAIALHCNINMLSIFHRKNYFYPDLPKAYQISQYDCPLAENGYLKLMQNNKNHNEYRTIGILRAHMEEDAGKLVHLIENGKITDSLVDYNRCGIPLLEIVTQPEITSSREAVQFLKKLRNIVQYLGVCDGNLERGSMRCDANISIRNAKSRKLGIKTEVKNMNSFKSVRKALDYEIKRQRERLNQGEKIIQETRRWDENKEITISMRSKEEAHDYRYFPEPDLMPLKITQESLKEIKNHFPELPEDRNNRFMQQYGLNHYDADRLVEIKSIADYYEQAVNYYQNYKKLANWILGELLRYLGEENKDIENSPVKARQLAELLQFIDKGTISGKMAKTIFDKMFFSGKDPGIIIQEEGLSLINDEEKITSIIQKVINENPKSIHDYCDGKDKALNYLVGQVMRYTKGRAKPDVVLEHIKKTVNKN